MTRPISAKAILAGAALDFLLSLGIGFTTMMVAGVRARIALLPPEDQERVLLEAVQSSPDLALWGVLFGSIASVVAGYVAGRLGRENPVWNAFWAGMPLTLLSGYSALTMDTPLPRWFVILLIPAGPALTTLGGWLASRRSSSPRALP